MIKKVLTTSFLFSQGILLVSILGTHKPYDLKRVRPIIGIIGIGIGISVFFRKSVSL